MKINKEYLLPFLIYNKPITYNNIILYPVTMNDVIMFQTFSNSITVRKNSIFRNKQIIKMSYLDFLFYSFGNTDLENEYKISDLSQYLFFALQLLRLCCKDQEVKIFQGNIFINNEIVTSEIFDNLRRIIIIQNEIDFDIDEFLNYDTEQKLLNAQHSVNKEENQANIEDYIDSLIIAMNISEERVMHMTIRKFWRYIKRYQLHEGYTIAKTDECSGMVSFKEPIKHWMASLEVDDKYKNIKMDENELKSKVS